MDWVERMNKVIEYIEIHLSDEIDTNEIGKIIACPFSVFHRSFAQIAGISLTEYVRRRRMTCAAYELQNTDIKVIDVALKYVYNSPDAFRVAFKKLHGINPKQAKNPDIILKFYSKLQFEVNIKGVYEMNYKMVEKRSFKVVGRRKITPYGGGTWAIVKSDGTLDKLLELSEANCVLGLCFGFDDGGNNDYMCGVEWDTDDVLDFDVYNYPDSMWLVFVSEGSLTDNVLYNTWERIKKEFIPNSNYVKLDLPTIEKYIHWNELEDYCKVEINVPVRKKL